MIDKIVERINSIPIEITINPIIRDNELWFLFGLQSRVENIKITHQIAFFWGIFLLFHFIIYLFNHKNTIKGIDKSEIFE